MVFRAAVVVTVGIAVPTGASDAGGGLEGSGSMKPSGVSAVHWERNHALHDEHWIRQRPCSRCCDGGFKQSTCVKGLVRSFHESNGALTVKRGPTGVGARWAEHHIGLCQSVHVFCDMSRPLGDVKSVEHTWDAVRVAADQEFDALVGELVNDPPHHRGVLFKRVKVTAIHEGRIIAMSDVDANDDVRFIS